jgi:hypothetical protein
VNCRKHQLKQLPKFLNQCKCQVTFKNFNYFKSLYKFIINKISGSSESDEEEDVIELSSDRLSNAERLQLLDNVQKRKATSRDKMAGQYNNKKRNKKTHAFVVDEIVTVFIPAIDRGHSDMPRMAAKVIKVIEKPNTTRRYTLATLFGVLDVNYCGRDIEVHCGLLNIDPKALGITTSLRTAAAKASNHSAPLSVTNTSCNCKSDCLKNYCECRKAGQKCTSHCHVQSNSKLCKNKD